MSHNNEAPMAAAAAPLADVPAVPIAAAAPVPALPALSREVPVRATGGLIHWAYVDAADYERVMEKKWSLDTRGYAMSTCRRPLLMHRLILDAKRGQIVDHIDGVPLNNRRANLRFATRHQNAQNARKCVDATSSRFKGVSFRVDRGKWRGSIYVAGVSRSLGNFANEEDAARAYDAAARIHYGAFACVNFPREGEQSALR